MPFEIQGSGNGTGIGSDTDGNMKVTLPQLTTGKVGLAGIAAVVHDGVTGAARLVRAGEISINRRLRVGADNLFFQDTFSYAAQNTAVWQNTLTTMTVTFGGGYTILNGGSSVASAAVARMTTYKLFPIYNGAGLSIEWDAILTQVPQTSNVIEMGVFQATGTAAPTDGILFRYTAGGVLVGVINYAGAETTVACATPSPGVDHSYTIRIEQEEVSFWIDGALQGSIATPAGQNGPCQVSYQPLTARNYNSGVTSLAQQLKIGEVRLFVRDISLTRPWAVLMGGNGGLGGQGQAGQTQGSTALYTNSLAPGAGVAATNTTAALGSGLGGQFALQPTLAANSDGIISSYQVPAGTAANPGKTLVVTGVRISGIVTTALTGGPIFGLWSLAFGHTAVSLATAEGAATKAPRRETLGIQTWVVTAAAGVQADREVVVKFDSPVMVNPGEFIQTVFKNIGTVTSAGVITFLIGLDCYFE